MSVASFLGALASVATIVGAITWLAKWLDHKFTSTPEEKRQDIAKKNNEEEENFMKTGRPQ